MFSGYPIRCISRPPNKAVILSEALHLSIAEGFNGAESKDPCEAYCQMLFGVFRPQTTTEDKKVTNSERSASQIYRVVQRLVARSRRACPERSRRNLEGSLSCQCCSELFDYPSPRTEFFLRYALDGHGYIFSCTVIIFHPQVCAASLNRGRSARCGLVVERVPTA